MPKSFLDLINDAEQSRRPALTFTDRTFAAMQTTDWASNWFTSPVAGSQIFIQAVPADHGGVGNFNFALGYGDNSGDATRADHVFTIGYNNTPGGGRVNTAEPAFEWRIEDYYAPTVTGARYVEAQWQYYDSTGGTFRPIAVQIDRSVGGYLTNTTVNVTGTSMSYTFMDGTQYLKAQQGSLLLVNGMVVIASNNNVQSFKQTNSAGTGTVSLAYLNNLDRVVIGDTNSVCDIVLAGTVVKAITGKRFLCIDANGVISSSTGAPTGT